MTIGKVLFPGNILINKTRPKILGVTHSKEGSSSEYSIEDFEHKDSVRLCKTNSTYHRREYNISTNLICSHILQHDITPWPGHYSNRFSKPATAHIARRFPWHVLSKQRSCPLITGFSSIWVSVTQPCHQSRRLGNKRVLPGKWGGTQFLPPL